MKVEIANLNEVLHDLELMSMSGNKAIDMTIKDVHRRGPSWVAQEVVKQYNLPKKDLMRNQHLHITATTSRGVLELKYVGEPLAPVGRYGLTPKKHRDSNYTMTAQVRRTGKKQAGQYKKKKERGGKYAKKSGNFLMLNGGTVPAQRVEPGHRGKVEVFRGPAASSLVVSPTSEPMVTKRLAEEFNKRLEHNLERAFK